MPYKDPEKRKAHKKKWRKSNKDKVAAYQKKYMKEYFKKNPRKSRSVSTKEFAIKRRELSKEDYRKWLKENTAKKLKLAGRKTYYRNKQIIDDYKLSHPCYCEEADIRCLEFHHRDPSTKLFQISTKGKKASVKKLMEEIEKCDVLCKNCHTKIHNENILEQDYEQKLKELDILLKQTVGRREKGKIHIKRYKVQSQIFVRNYKNENDCKNCGEKDPNCLVFHHRNSDEKSGKISLFYKSGVKRTKKEIDKCDLLCHNCHSKIHHIEDHPLKHDNTL